MKSQCIGERVIYKIKLAGLYNNCNDSTGQRFIANAKGNTKTKISNQVLVRFETVSINEYVSLLRDWIISCV